MNRFAACVVVALAVGCAQALGATDEHSTTVDIQVSQPALSAQQAGANQPSMATQRGPEDSQLEFFASSWAPRGLQSASWLPNAPAFSSVALPALAANYVSSAWRGRLGSLAWLAGVQYQQLSRSLTVSLTEGPQLAWQNLYLFGLRLGAEYRPPLLQNRWASPYADLAAMPLGGLSPEGPFADDTAMGGIAALGTLGATSELGGLLPRGWALEAALTGSAGTLQSNGQANSLTSWGVQAGMRVSL